LKININFLIMGIIYVLFASVMIIIAVMCQKLSPYIFALFALFILLFFIINGISQKKYDKQAAEINKSRIIKLMNIVNAYVVIWTEDKESVIVNDKLKGVIGDTIAGLNNKELIDIIFPQGFISQTIAEMMLSSAVKELSMKINDKIIYIAWSSSVLLMGNDGQYIISIGFDVTENKIIRQQLNITNNSLASSERRHSLAMDLSEIGIILNEHCYESFHVSEELKKMLGLAEDKIKIDDFVKLIHNDERILFETYLKTATDKNINDSHTHSMDIRILSVDGQYRWYSFRYKNIHTGTYGMPVIGGAIIDISKEKDKDILIERMAYIDEITGLFNRNKLMINGQEIYECCKILKMSYLVIVFDIDRFHIINDTCGYNNGNQTLKDFAQILNKKKMKNGFAARIGGDNFVLIIQDYGNSKFPEMLVKEIQSEFSHMENEHMFKQSLSCSAGYSKMPDDGPDFATVFERAEFALSTGEKRRVVIGYDSTVHDAIIKGTALEKSLADAIEAGEMELYYQPKISLTTKKIIGVEALIRWVKPDGEVIPPSKFVPVAENSHLITKIGEYVMQEACKQNKIWQDMGLPNIVMSINLTSEDFYQKNVKQYISEILSQTKLSPEWLEIEITESLAMKDIDFAVQQMQELRDMGLKLAMDDFGTGYSSLSYIQKMPISLLKLDRSFIILLEDDLVAQEIVSAVIKIAKSKKIETIAEGTETIGQIEILEKLGCDYAQGFLFGKPMRASELTGYLSKSMEQGYV